MVKLSKVLMVFLAVAIIAGCGIAKNKYDAVVKDMTEFQNKAKSLGTQVEKLKTDHERLLKDYDTLKAENTKILNENKSLTAECEKLKAEKEELLKR